VVLRVIHVTGNLLPLENRQSVAYGGCVNCLVASEAGL